MHADDLYQSLLYELQSQIQVLKDKAEETPVATLRALWFCAAGEAKSVQASALGLLPELDNDQTKQLIYLALPRIEWVDYRMGHARQRAVYTDIGYPFAMEGD